VDGDLRIRPATGADLPALVGAFGDEHFFQSRDPAAGVLLVAWLDGRPVGDVWLSWTPSDPAIAERLPNAPMLVHLEVTPPLRGHGVGTALVHAAGTVAHDRGAPLTSLLVTVDNLDAARLYARLGYVDWEGGEVVNVWTRHLPDGSQHQVREACHLLIRSTVPDVPGLDAWRAWHPREAAVRLAAVPVCWHVAGGWALDLWHGEQTRGHGDLEIAVPRADFARLRPALAGLTLHPAGPGMLRRLADGEEPGPDVHQVWVCDPVAGEWRMDTFLEPGTGDTWICRRDESIREPYEAVVARTAGGIPYLRPEAVLLFKAKHRRPKDEADFDRALPRLDPAPRRWLADRLDRIHPGHEWIAALVR
jgi:GNAT superfamily N-acetyltransferase